MRIEDIKEFGIFAYIDNCGKSAFVEVLKVYVNEKKVKVSIYNSKNIEITDIVSSDNLLPVTLTEAILKALSFEEVTGHLYGLPNEHYFQLRKDNGKIEILRDRGAIKYVQPSMDRENWFGCKFIPMPYLHQLQDKIGRIDLKCFVNELSKDEDNTTPTT